MNPPKLPKYKGGHVVRWHEARFTRFTKNANHPSPHVEIIMLPCHIQLSCNMLYYFCLG